MASIAQMRRTRGRFFLGEEIVVLLKRFRQRFVPRLTWIPPSYNSSSSVIVQVVNELQLQKQVQRVPPLFKKSKAHQNAYDPVIISIGPYHHGNTNYSHAEAFKEKSLDLFVSENNNHDKAYFHEMILQRIQDIRDCYEMIEVHDDETLAWIILRDACFIICHLQCLTREGDSGLTKFTAYYTHFGATRIEYIARDLLLLENQIPFWIIKHVLCLQSVTQGASTWNQLLCMFTNKVLFGEGDHVLYLPFDAFHLLDAYYKVLKLQFPVGDCELPTICGISVGKDDKRNPHTYRFRSIIDLTTNGISLVASISQLEKAIKFTYEFSGELHLPPLVLPTDFFVLYSNLIAYETSPAGKSDFFVSSFVNFMKALIQSPGDVKILREEGILFNMISDDDVVKGIQDLDTFGLENFSTFSEIRSSIERHCSIRANSWTAELVRTTLKNPCTILALIAAVVLLCLTFLQTFFTIRPL